MRTAFSLFRGYIDFLSVRVLRRSNYIVLCVFVSIFCNSLESIVA